MRASGTCFAFPFHTTRGLERLEEFYFESCPSSVTACLGKWHVTFDSLIAAPSAPPPLSPSWPQHCCRRRVMVCVVASALPPPPRCGLRRSHFRCCCIDSRLCKFCSVFFRRNCRLMLGVFVSPSSSPPHRHIVAPPSPPPPSPSCHRGVMATVVTPHRSP